MKSEDKILVECLTELNADFMNNLPQNIEPHNFSIGFERKCEG